MSRRATVVLCVVSALNIIALAINISLPSKAAVGGMHYQALMRDPDFTRAVKAIAEGCSVNVGIAKIAC